MGRKKTDRESLNIRIAKSLKAILNDKCGKRGAGLVIEKLLKKEFKIT